MNPNVALFLPNLDGGGAERAFVELANQFADLGLRVDLVLSVLRGPYVQEISRRVRVVDFRSSNKLNTMFRLVTYLRTEKPDVLMSGLDTTNLGAIVASVLSGRRNRCVICQRAVLRAAWKHESPGIYNFAMRALRLTYALAPLIISNSYAAKNDLVDGLGISVAKCHVIHNSVDLENIRQLSQAEIRHPWIGHCPPPFICSVGTLTSRKDMETVIRAYALVRKRRHCRLVILGEGSERPKLERLVRELDLAGSVLMPGFVTNPFPWIARARVLVSASLLEGCPNVVQQALACGTPVVATDCPGGTREVLGEGRWGRLVRVRDSISMSEAILATFEDSCPPDGRERALDFHPTRTAQAYLDLIKAKFSEAPLPTNRG